MKTPVPEFGQTRLILRAVVGSMILAPVLFAGVALWLVRSGSMGELDALPPIALPAVAVAVLITLLLAPVVQAKVGTAPPGADARTILARWQSGVIVGAALREGMGLLGIVLGLVAGSAPWILAMAGVTVLSLLLAFPRGEEVEMRLRQLPPE